MKKISTLIALACALIMTGCAGGVKTGKPSRDDLAGPRHEQKKSIAEQSAKTKAAMSAYTTKSTPVGADTFLLSDSEAANATKKATLSSTKAALGLGTSDNPSFNSIHASGGNLAAANKQVTKAWQTGLPYTANITSVIYGGKHYICTSTHTADSTTEPGVGASWATVWGEVTGGGVSAWSDIQALLTGSGTYVKADGTTGDPTGTLPTGTEGQTVQYGSGGTPAAVDLEPLAFTDNVSRNSSTGVVSVPVTSTATSGSAVPFTSGGAYTALAGKQGADADLTTAAGATGAGNSKYFGTNSSGTAGFYDLPTEGSGSFAFDTFPAYEDSAHSSGIAVNGTTLAVYSSTAGKWMTVGLTDTLDASPTTYTLTIDGTGWDGTDSISVGGSTYTADGAKTGLSGATSVTVTPNTGRTATCSGTGITGSSSPYSADMSTDRTVACTFSNSVTDETLTPSAVNPAWTKVGAGTNLSTLTDSDDTTYFYTSSTSTTISMTMGSVVGSGTIAGVKMCGRVKFDSTATYGPRFRLHNGSTYQSFSPDPIAGLTTSWQDICSSEMTTNPYTSSAWIASELNALSWYIASNANSNSGAQTQVSKMWGVVRYQ